MRSADPRLRPDLPRLRSGLNSGRSAQRYSSTSLAYKVETFEFDAGGRLAFGNELDRTFGWRVRLILLKRMELIGLALPAAAASKCLRAPARCPDRHRCTA